LFWIAFFIKLRFPHPFFTIIFHCVYNQPINPMCIPFRNMLTLVIDLGCMMQHTNLLHQSIEKFIFHGMWTIAQFCFPHIHRFIDVWIFSLRKGGLWISHV
jgi:hypothetical protein